MLVARLTASEQRTTFSLCHYFAISKQLWENGSCYVGRNEIAGLKGKSGPPGNMNVFKHGLAAIQKRREESITTEHEESVRQQILDGLIADKGGDERYRQPPVFSPMPHGLWSSTVPASSRTIRSETESKRLKPARWLQAWPGELVDWESPEVRPGPSAQDRNSRRGAPGR
jgi:hypothetical protein